MFSNIMKGMMDSIVSRVIAPFPTNSWKWERVESPCLSISSNKSACKHEFILLQKTSQWIFLKFTNYASNIFNFITCVSHFDLKDFFFILSCVFISILFTSLNFFFKLCNGMMSRRESHV